MVNYVDFIVPYFKVFISNAVAKFNFDFNLIHSALPFCANLKVCTEKIFPKTWKKRRDDWLIWLHYNSAIKHYLINRNQQTLGAHYFQHQLL